MVKLSDFGEILEIVGLLKQTKEAKKRLAKSTTQMKSKNEKFGVADDYLVFNNECNSILAMSYHGCYVGEEVVHALDEVLSQRILELEQWLSKQGVDPSE